MGTRCETADVHPVAEAGHRHRAACARSLPCRAQSRAAVPALGLRSARRRADRARRRIDCRPPARRLGEIEGRERGDLRPRLMGLVAASELLLRVDVLGGDPTARHRRQLPVGMARARRTSLHLLAARLCFGNSTARRAHGAKIRCGLPRVSDADQRLFSLAAAGRAMTLGGQRAKLAAISAFERIPLPDSVTRIAIEALVKRTRTAFPANGDGATREFARLMTARPVAVHAEAANEQHYEVPAEFFGLVLGPRRKYSSCLYEGGAASLAEAELEALEATAANASLSDGQSILELGCGWGSLSLFLAETMPRSNILAVSNSLSQRAFIE